MPTRTQLIRSFTIAAALAVATAVTPATHNAFADNDNEDENEQQAPHRGAPEVDPGTLGSAIALAMGGLAVLNDKRRRR